MSEENQETGSGGSELYTFDDMEKHYATPTPTDLSQVKLDGDEVPETLRGKSVKDLLELNNRQQEALRISEEARLALKNSQEALESSRSPAPAPVQPPAPQAEPELTDEQLDELFQNSPRKYHEYMADRAEKRVLSRVQGLISPVVGNTTDMAIRDAERRFPDEFAAFGKEIRNWISGLPDKTVLGAPGAMDEAMDYLRGKHWKKFQEHQNSKQDGGLEAARRQLAEETPTDLNRGTPKPQNGSRKTGPVQLDQTMKDIADALGISHEDYAKGITARDLKMMREYADR